MKVAIKDTQNRDLRYKAGRFILDDKAIYLGLKNMTQPCLESVADITSSRFSSGHTRLFPYCADSCCK